MSRICAVSSLFDTLSQARERRVGAKRCAAAGGRASGRSPFPVPDRSGSKGSRRFRGGDAFGGARKDGSGPEVVETAMAYVEVRLEWAPVAGEGAEATVSIDAVDGIRSVIIVVRRGIRRSKSGHARVATESQYAEARGLLRGKSYINIVLTMLSLDAMGVRGGDSRRARRSSLVGAVASTQHGAWNSRRKPLVLRIRVREEAPT